MPENTSVNTQATPALAWPDPPQVVPCSWNECAAGHRWKPVFLVTTCPGCDTQFLAQQKTQCPVCNEQMVRRSLRVDLVPRGGGVAKRCCGSEVVGESVTVEMDCTGWQEVVDGKVRSTEFFEERSARPTAEVKCQSK